MKLINEGIVAQYAQNYLVSDNNEYIFVAISNDQKTNMYRINSDNVAKMELKDYNSIFGFSYIIK